MTELPDFLKLSDEQISAEKERQRRLRVDFNSRVRQTGAQTEFARALIIESEIRKEIEATGGDDQLKNRLAEVLAAQGRFIEAADTAAGADEQDFYNNAAAAIYDATDCECEPPLTAGPNNSLLRMPKHRVIKEVYSLKEGRFGYLVECNGCSRWVFMPTSPALPEIDPKDFNDDTPDDTVRLRA
jgi:hypothetical protein